MAIDPMSAAAAYRANATGPNMFHTGSQPQAQPASGSSFLDMVKGVAEDAMQSNYKAEEVTARALAEAESTLSTVVTVRDRVISAYQEILRMPI